MAFGVLSLDALTSNSLSLLLSCSPPGYLCLLSDSLVPPLLCSFGVHLCSTVGALVFGSPLFPESMEDSVVFTFFDGRANKLGQHTISRYQAVTSVIEELCQKFDLTDANTLAADYDLYDLDGTVIYGIVGTTVNKMDRRLVIAALDLTESEASSDNGGQDVGDNGPLASFLIRGGRGERLGAVSLRRTTDIAYVKERVFRTLDLQDHGFEVDNFDLIDSQGTPLEGFAGDVIDLEDKTLTVRQRFHYPYNPRRRNLTFTVYSVSGRALGSVVLAKADGLDLIKWQVFYHLRTGNLGSVTLGSFDLVCSKGLVQDSWRVSDFLDPDNLWLTVVLGESGFEEDD